MEPAPQDRSIIDKLLALAKERGLQVEGGTVRRTSSRFCLGVEHGDYNGTELFGVGTDRFIWLAYRPNGTDTIRLYSGNFPDEGVVTFRIGQVPAPRSPEIAAPWARFPFGVDHIMRREGIQIRKGYDAVLYGNIPGGGMSRSASLAVNLILTALDVNGITLEDRFAVVDIAQAVETDYIGSPCGQLDQIMIYFAREGMGTHYNPKTRSIDYVPLGEKAAGLRIVTLDTGTDRPGLEKSTYKVRREECDELVALARKAGFGITCLADVRDEKLYRDILGKFEGERPELCSRLTYIFKAQKRFYQMLEAWKQGDIEQIGSIFRADGIGLRDEYRISGAELESMCDIARTVPGVLGERMLGGGDKGAAGALVRAESVGALQDAVKLAYPRSRPDYAGRHAVHACSIVDGVKVFEGAI